MENNDLIEGIDYLPVHCINPDYLTIMFTGDILIDHDAEQSEINGVIVEPLKYGDQLAGNKHFKNISFVYLAGEVIGEIRYNPRNYKVIQANCVSFKAANSLLYTRNYWEAIEETITRLGLKFSHVSKMDLAVDGIGFLQPIDLWFRGTIKKMNRVKTTPFYSSEKGDAVIEGFWLGSRKSDKFARGYYKGRELLKSGKEYIRQFWKENNLFEKCGTDDIERLELSMKNAELKRWLKKEERETWEGFKSFISSVQKIASLFNEAIATLYDFRENKEVSNVTQQLRKYFVLDFSPLTVLNGIEKAAAIVSAKLKSLKTTAKNMFLLWKKTGCKHFQILGEEIAANIFQTKWFERQKRKWSYEYNREQKKHGDYFPVYDCLERVRGVGSVSGDDHVIYQYRGAKFDLHFNKYLVKNVLKQIGNV